MDVTVLKARDLRGPVDSFVKLHLTHRGSEVDGRTGTVRTHNSEPVFNETFNLSLPNHIEAGNQINLIISVRTAEDGERLRI